MGGTRVMDLREARDTGCLRDLSAEPFKRHLQFEHDGQKPRGWWNGFLYSPYQLLALPALEARSCRTQVSDARPAAIRASPQA